jgi:hypothetical protein
LESSRGHEPAEIHRHFHDGGQSYNSQLHPMDPIPIPEQRSQAKPCDAPAAFLARFKTTARTADIRLVAPELILRLSQSGNTGFWLLLQKPNSLREGTALNWQENRSAQVFTRQTVSRSWTMPIERRVQWRQVKHLAAKDVSGILLFGGRPAKRSRRVIL